MGFQAVPGKGFGSACAHELVGADRVDGDVGQQAHIDVAIVIAVDDHLIFKLAAFQVVPVEFLQGVEILDFLEADDIGLDGADRFGGKAPDRLHGFFK